MTPDELKSQLDNLKTQLEAVADQKAKAAIEAEIKKITTQLEGYVAKSDFEAVKTELKESNEKLAKVVAEQDRQAAEGLSVKQKGEVKAFNTLLAEGIEENQDKIKALKKGKSVDFELKAVGDMSFANNFSTADVSVANLRPGIIELPKRRLHIRELVPGGTMSTSNLVYVRETSGEGNPATVAEGNWKEQFDLDLEEVESPSQYIAGYVVISRKMLDDVQGMTSFLQSRLLEKYLRAEDVQLLFGDGNSPNLSGITDTGNFTAPNGAATIDVEQLVEAVSQLESYDREANGILLHPRNYYNILLNKSGGSEEYDLPTALATIQNGQLYIAGIPVFRSTAMQSDKFLVGDWRMGCQLYQREAPRIEFFYEDGNNVRRNQVTVRVEGRIAFPVFGSDYFIYGDFGNS